MTDSPVWGNKITGGKTVSEVENPEIWLRLEESKREEFHRMR